MKSVEDQAVVRQHEISLHTTIINPCTYKTQQRSKCRLTKITDSIQVHMKFANDVAPLSLIGKCNVNQFYSSAGWRLIQQLCEEFWSKLRTEHLNSIQTRKSCHIIVTESIIVLD